MVIEYTLIFVFAYMIGSVPFGLLLTKAAGLGDIRQIGSGNIGATNVLRTGHKGLALLTLLLDAFKGWAAINLIMIALAAYFVPGQIDLVMDEPPYNRFIVYAASLCAIGAVIGHVFPVWLKFKGGKGVATALGACIGLNPFIGFAVCLSWLLTALMFRWSSLASLVSMITMPGFAWYLGHEQFVMPLIVIALLVIYRHKENIIRLKNGTEPKIGQKK